MTCTHGDRRRARPAPPAAGLSPGDRLRSSRRWKLIGSEPLLQQRVVERAQVEARSPSRRCSSARSWSSRTLPEQVRQLVGRGVGVAVDLGPGVRRPRSSCLETRNSVASSTVISPRCIRTSRMIRQARQIASVYIASRKFGASSKPCSRIICSEYMPQPSTNSGASVAAGSGSDGGSPPQLEVVAGVRLVDAGVADRAAVVLAHRVRVVADRRRDDVDALRVGGRTSAAEK